MQQHVQPLVDGEQGQVQPVVQLLQLPGTCGEGRVDFHLVAVLEFELFGLTHLPESFLDAHLLVLVVGIDLEAVNGLQQLGLLVQQLLQHLLLLLLRQARSLDARSLLQPPPLQLVVQDLEVSGGARVHAPLNLTPPVCVCLLLRPQLLLPQEGLALQLLAAKVGGALAADPAARVALDGAHCGRHDGQPLLRGLVAARSDESVACCVNQHSRPLHLRCCLAHCLLCACGQLDSLCLTLQLGLCIGVLGLPWRLRACMMVHCACALVLEATKVGFSVLLGVVQQNPDHLVWQARALHDFHVDGLEARCKIMLCMVEGRGRCRILRGGGGGRPGCRPLLCLYTDRS
mmetsp:Transcript_13761/g.29614  ORF Transcript_13761/g.29614 Transcript_13761/m.29614 type:complete len:345 (-) Transcript_13761:1089-2123(-)